MLNRFMHLIVQKKVIMFGKIKPISSLLISAVPRLLRFLKLGLLLIVNTLVSLIEAQI